MTENTIHYSGLAKQDLDEIYDYISLELQNPTAAQDTITGILSEISSLKLHPKSGKIVSLPNGMDSEYRFVMYKNYLAFLQRNSASYQKFLSLFWYIIYTESIGRI